MGNNQKNVNYKQTRNIIIIGIIKTFLSLNLIYKFPLTSPIKSGKTSN